MFNLGRTPPHQKKVNEVHFTFMVGGPGRGGPQRYRLVIAIIADGCWLLQPGSASSVVSQW